MATPEGKVKIQVKNLLKKHGAVWHMPVQNGMGSPTLDFHVWYRGFGCLIETKAPGKKPTPRQSLTIAAMRAGGATVFVTDGDLSPIEKWLVECDAWAKLLMAAECTLTTDGSSSSTTHESLP